MISVVIPLYNREKYILDCLQSVLNQTYNNREIIVVDDGSTDNSANLIKNLSPLIKYSYKKHSGIVETLNLGIEQAQGQYLTFIDSDDLWDSDRLMQQINVITTKPKIDIVYGWVQEFICPSDQPKNIIPKKNEAQHTNSMLIERNKFLQVGLFDIKFPSMQSMEWHLRAVKHNFNTLIMDQVLWHRRIHHNNYCTKYKQDLIKNVFKIIRAQQHEHN